MRLNSDKYGRFCWILQNNHIVHFMIWIRTRFTTGIRTEALLRSIVPLWRMWSWGDRLFSKFHEVLQSARKAYFLTDAADVLFREVPRKFVKIRESHPKIRQRLDNI